MKRIDTYLYLSELKKLVEQGETVGVPVAGNSMEPFLKDQRDFVYFRKPEGALKPGDIVFFQRRNGQYIMHRIQNIQIYKNRDGTEEKRFDLAGDNQRNIEPGIRYGQIFAKVVQVKRKGRLLDETDLMWKFYAKFWPFVIEMRGKRSVHKKKIFPKLFSRIKKNRKLQRSSEKNRENSK